MNTQLEVIIDFDDASKEWRKNKIYISNGKFQYKCQKENCNNPIYLYTTEHKQFALFASDFDLLHKNNPNKHIYCEDHLLT